jgi:uncharacterized membrane protein YfcA
MGMAVPFSLAGVVASSFAASQEYLKKGLADMELVLVISVFMVLGNMAGGLLSTIVPEAVLRFLFALVLVYSAVAFWSRNNQVEVAEHATTLDRRQLGIVGITTLVAGAVGALVGIGGGVVVVPLVHLLMRRSLAVARGTSAFVIAFSTGAALAVYSLLDKIDLAAAGGIVLGSLIGARLGGRLGTVAKPTIVRLLFTIVLVYVAIRLAAEGLK